MGWGSGEGGEAGERLVEELDEELGERRGVVLVGGRGGVEALLVRGEGLATGTSPV